MSEFEKVVGVYDKDDATQPVGIFMRIPTRSDETYVELVWPRFKTENGCFSEYVNINGHLVEHTFNELVLAARWVYENKSISRLDLNKRFTRYDHLTPITTIETLESILKTLEI